MSKNMAHNLWCVDNVVERVIRRERVFRDCSNLLEIHRSEDSKMFSFDKKLS